jgi:PAS domain S-box-containing protein
MDDSSELDRLRLAEARLAGLIAIAVDAIISVDEEHRITLFNQGAQQIFGYTPAEVLGQPLDMLMPEALATLHLEYLRKFGQSGAQSRRMGERQEVYGRRKSGEIFPAEASISRVELNGIAIYTAVLRDVTDAKRTQTNMMELLRREYQARTARDSILSAVSHDLTNPISAIRMCTTTLLTAQQLKPETQHGLLRTIRDSAEWMQRMIQDLLDITNIEAGHLSVRRASDDCLHIIGRALALFTPIAQERNVRLDTVVPESLPNVYIDADRILQVLSNLLGNAIKFSDAGETVTLRAEAHAEGVCVSVTDTGPGMTADEQAHLFDRFWDGWRQSRAARPRGSGLGLAIAKGIIDMHRSHIWCESTLGHGSTFYFTMPLMAHLEQVATP